MSIYSQFCISHFFLKNYKHMNTTLLEELQLKISKIDQKLERLLYKGSNDESLVDKKRKLLKQYFELKQKPK